MVVADKYIHVHKTDARTIYTHAYLWLQMEVEAKGRVGGSGQRKARAGGVYVAAPVAAAGGGDLLRQVVVVGVAMVAVTMRGLLRQLGPRRQWRRQRAGAGAGEGPAAAAAAAGGVGPHFVRPPSVLLLDHVQATRRDASASASPGG